LLIPKYVELFNPVLKPELSRRSDASTDLAVAPVPYINSGTQILPPGKYFLADSLDLS